MSLQWILQKAWQQQQQHKGGRRDRHIFKHCIKNKQTNKQIFNWMKRETNGLGNATSLQIHSLQVKLRHERKEVSYFKT